MPAALDLQGLWISFGAVLAILLSLIEFFPVRRTALPQLYSGMLLAIGLLQGVFYLHSNGIIGPFFFVAALYFPAPFILLAGLALASEDFDLKPAHLGCFVPAALVLALVSCLPYIPEKASRILSALTYIAPVYTVAYLVPLFRIFMSVRKIMARALIAIFIADTVIVAALFEMGFTAWAAIVITFVICLIAWLRIKYPEVVADLRKEITSVKYARSKLAGLDIDFLAQKLVWLMENDRLYTRDDLTLAALAQQLALTSHQLSELINRKFAVGYFAFINRYRVDEAKKQLSGSDRTILQIAMQVGFNNKSSFNEAFSRFAGCTPLEFRGKNAVLK